MHSEPLDVIPLWGMFFGASLLVLLALEGGYQLGRWRHAHVVGEKEAPVGAMVGSILGLLAMMLAFTFNLAATRFDERRQAVLDEANAIGTTYLRARLLSEPQRSELQALLREYTDVRLRTVQEGGVAEGIVRSEELHQELWSRAVAAAEKHPGLITTGLFLQSLNDVIDLHAKRLHVSMGSRMPPMIWFSLFILALLGMTAMGYQAGLSWTRRSPAELLLALAFAGILYLIVDLDRSQEGLLRVSQQAMLDVRRSMPSP